MVTLCAVAGVIAISLSVAVTALGATSSESKFVELELFDTTS